MKFFFQYLENPDKDRSNSNYWRDSSFDVRGVLAESLLFGECTTIRLAYGSTPKLVSWLGVGLLIELIDEGIINFCALKPLGTAYLTNEWIREHRIDVPPGLTLLMGREPENTTVFGKVASTLEVYTNLSRKERRQIARKIEKNSRELNNDVVYDSNSAAKNDIIGEIGKEISFPINEDPDSGDLKKEHIFQYLSVADANLNLRLAAELGCDNIIANRLTERVLEKKLTTALDQSNVSLSDYRFLLKLEKVPDLSSLLKSGRISFKDIVQLSRSKEAEDFRKWVKSIDSSCDLDITRQYQLEILKRKIDSKLLKSIKVVGYTSLGAISTLFDPTGGIASGLIINSFDAFILNALKREWKPKIFIDQLKNLDA